MTSCLLCNGPAEEVLLNGLFYERCSRCRFLFAREGASLDHYAHKETDLSPQKIAARTRNAASRINTIAPFANLNNLCDVGAGEGTMLAALYKAGYRNLVGIEPAYAGTLTGEERFSLIQGTLDELPAVRRDHEFKNVSMFHVIEHVPDAPRALRKIFDILPQGGALMIETPDSDSYLLRASGYTHDLIYPEHISLFNRNNLRCAVRQAGFEIVADGRRDFDPPLSIRESLIRLGVRPYHQVKNRMVHNKKRVPDASPSGSHPLKSLARSLLYKLVTLLHREDYLWLVARKPQSNAY